MITGNQHELLKDIINNTERPDKIAVRLESVSRTMTVEYEDMDEEWFREMLELPQKRVSLPQEIDLTFGETNG